MSGYSSPDYSSLRLLASTAATNCAAGILGAATAGKARDTFLLGVYIQFAAGPPVLTIGGLLDSAGNAANLVVSGSTTVDYFWMPPVPILNEFGAFTFTASVAAKIWVALRACTGP
jgi:hypothetical protein